MKSLFKCLLYSSVLLLALKGYAQEYNQFDIRYVDNIKGDLTFIGNSILNRDGGTSSTEPNDPYDNLSTNNINNDETGGRYNYNDYKDMQYIDVDNDASTFSSSSATFAYDDANCSLIRYAGLYWSATYPSELGSQSEGTNRQNDFNQVKLMVPGGSYVDITADEILFDGFTEPDLQDNSPYACYADVTGLLTALANPEGEYTVANVRAVNGDMLGRGGAAAGWTLVIVYENPNLTGKYITTFDGFARVNSANPTVDINYNGFTTIPVGPVNADIGVAALEGDFRISGDGMSIEAASNTGFTTISTTENPGTNFFNSNITLDDVNTTNRNPASLNTLGYDTDMFLLSNPSNAVIPNDETAATFRFTSSGDQYYPFFNSFNVEIIEPNVVLEKKVEDLGGTDITGLGVNLGQELYYVLSFANIGNDDVANYTIRDILPVNVTLDESDIDLPPGVTYTFDTATREIIFSIPDNLVEEGDPVSEIEMRVQVAENCFDFIDACSDIIENIAYSTYEGVINDNQITDDPSVSDFDDCGFTTPGASNFLLDDLSSCDYDRTVQLCGDDVLLDAGDNFDAYTWYLDENGNNVIDAGDTVVTDADSDNDPSTLLVDETGTYIVDKEVADPCKGFQEIIIVELFGATQTNPIIDLINDTSNSVEGEVVVCPNDGEELPEIFLCGLNDTELIQINIPDADSIEWEQLDEASCTASTDDCANKNNSCAWNNVGMGSDYLASDSGEYRITINYQNGCFSRFYFNIYKNPLDPQYNSSDIICNTPGNITVTNMPVDYEYRLIDASTSSVVTSYQTSPSFDIATNGAYTVEMRQVGVTGGCVFSIENISIQSRDFQVDVSTRDTDCNGLGEISISVLDVEPQYYYEISQGGTIVDTYGPATDNNYTFENLNDGVYDIDISTDDGCAYSGQATINDVSDLALSAITTKNIDCTDGSVSVTATGGFPNPNYNYAIWSYNGTDLYTDVSDIPGSAYQVTGDFTFALGEEGDYEFIVVDGNNCTAISNVVSVIVQPAIEYTTAITNETCYGIEDGSYTVNVTNTNGYSVSFTLTYPDASTETNTSGVFTDLPSGGYALTITQAQGGVSCDYVETFSVGGPTAPINADAVLLQDYTCLQTAIIEAQNVAGGTPPYEFSIDGINFVSGIGAEQFTGLTDGTYAITVRDDNGCTFVTNQVVVDPFTPPSDLTFSDTEPTCANNTSDVTVTVADGEAPYIVEVITPSAITATSIAGNVAIFDNLPPNSYVFRVIDANGCTYDESYTVDPVIPISVTGLLVSNVTCFADTDGEMSFTVSGYGSNYDYSITGPSNFSGNNETNNTLTFNSLDNGTYSITVTDTVTGCIATDSVTINAPSAPLAISVNERQPTCIADGDVTISATGGWGGNSFTLTNPDASVFGTNSTGIFTNLAQTGTYTASVSDINGCTDTTTFTLNAAISPVLQITPNDFCYDDAVGLTLTAMVTSGGDGNFEYNLNGGAFSANNTFTGLGPGTYTVGVRDGNDCMDSETITINPEVTVTATASNITACGTDTNVDITAAGGDGNYVFAVVGDGVTPIAGDFNTANPIAVTGAGDYDVYVRDNGSGTGFCEAMFDITITQDLPITITPTVVDVTCFGSTDGSITLVAGGGEGPYQYSIDNGTNYQTSGSFPNLSAGTYPIRVQDANGCEEALNVTVAEPAQLSAEATTTQTYDCTQLGEITVGSVTPTAGGSGDYQYSLNGGAWTTSTTGGATFTGLVNGTYTITVRDANAVGCTLVLPNIVIAPLPVEPTPSTSLTYNCDGTADITVLPSDPSYAYSLNGGTFQASNTFAGVAVGTHILTIDYGSNCTVDTSIIVDPGNAFTAAITAFDDISCYGASDGAISFEIENFDPVNGFEYAVNGGAFSAPQTTSPITITGLAAGNHTIVVRDVLDSSCTITLNQTLAEPAPIVAAASITDVLTCTNGGATITASASGGIPNYEYELQDSVGTAITGYDFASNGTNTIFTGLAAGDYIVMARDSNGCSDPIDVSLTVVAPTGLAFTVTETACYGGASNATIQVDVTAGNGNYRFSLNGGAFIAPSPTTNTTHTFTGLSAGTYTIDVRDEFGCTAPQQSVTIEPLLNAVVDVDDVTSCSNGLITVTASGGDGNYQYAFVPTTTSPTGLFTTTNTYVVAPGNEGDYDVYVRDNSATSPYCEYVETVTVNPATPIAYTATPTDPECYDGLGSIAIAISSGNSPYTIQIVDLDNGGAGNQTNSNVLSNTFTYYNLLPGDYDITVTDAHGCSLSNPTVTINNPDELTGTVAGITPATCTGLSSDFGFGFSGYPTSLGTIEFSDDGGATWIGDNSVPGTTDQFTGYNSGDTVYPSMRTVNGVGNTICQTDLPPFIIPYPLDDLDISILAIVVNCNELQVTVQGAEGTPDYQYSYSDDPANFDPVTPTIPWTTPAQDAVTPYVFTGLIPGRTYTFYVRDAAGCVRQSNVNVNDLVTQPLGITSSITPSCSGSNNGSISYTITENVASAGTDIQWSFYDMSTGTPVLVSDSGGNVPFTSPQTVTINSLGTGNYFIEVTKMNGVTPSCVSASENELLEELDALSGTLAVLQDITCDMPGLIEIQNMTGGGGTYTYDVTGPAGFTPISGTADNPIEIAANSPAGSYSVTVTDQYGCSTNLGNVNLSLSPNPTIDSIVVDNCSAQADVTISATSSAAQLFYSIDGGASYLDNGGVFTNVGPGTYTVSILDSNGCTDTGSVTVYDQLQATSTISKLLDCSISPNGEITITVNSGSGDYDYEIDGPGAADQTRTNMGGTSLTWTGASVDGSYVVTVYDNNTSVPECSVSQTLTMGPALVPIFTETHLDVSCNGANDGNISLFATDNGIIPLTYSISPVAGTFNATTNTFENLPAGTYTITATASNDCTSAITGIIIAEPAVISVPSPTVVEFGCSVGNNTDNATVTIDASGISGGSGNYVIYEFIDNATTSVLQSGTNNIYEETSFTGRTLDINVYDDNGCVGSTIATIQPFNELLSASIVVDTPISCLVDEDITITATGSLSDSTTSPSDYEFRILPSGIFQTSGSFTGLAPGTHNFEARNTATGCLLTITHTVGEPNTFGIDVNVLSNVVCFGTQSGQIEFELIDALGVYTSDVSYTIYDSLSATVTSGTFTTTGPNTVPQLLFVGDYTIEVIQDNFPECTNTAAFSIAGPPAAITANTVVTDITCLGNDGQIEITNVSGGWSGYQYYVGTTAPVGPASYVASPIFTGLTPGTYEAWVIDSAGCEFQLPDVTLADPTPITATLQINNDNCTDIEGEIQVVSVSGGQGNNYTFQLIRNGVPVGSPQTSDTFTNLGEGSYGVLVADQWSCTFTTAAALLYDEMVLTSTVIKPIDCSANPGGEITISVSGGSGNYSFTATPPLFGAPITNTTGVFAGLNDVGPYIFVVTDLSTGTPCAKTITQELTAPTPVTFDTHTVVDVSCNGGVDGSIIVNLTPTGIGVNDDPVYIFNLYDATGTTLLYGPQNDPVFDSLSAGTYTVEALSGKQCALTEIVTVNEPTVVSATAFATSFACNSSNGVETSTITVTASGGSGGYLYSIDGINFQTTNTLEVVDNGSVQNLNIVVEDSNGCSVTVPITIDPINVFTASVAQNTAISCANSEEVLITVSDNGNPANLYTFELLPVGNTAGSYVSNPTNASSIFALSVEGSYVFRITDTDTGCYVDTVPYDIAPYDLIDVTASATAATICFGDASGALEFNISGYSGDYDYEVFDTTGVSTGIFGSGNTGANPLSVTGLSGGNYLSELPKPTIHYVQKIPTQSPLSLQTPC